MDLFSKLSNFKKKKDETSSTSSLTSTTTSSAMPTPSPPSSSSTSATPAAAASSSSPLSPREASNANAAYLARLKDYLLLMEYSKLRHQCPSGMYVLPSTTTSSALGLRRWDGVIFIRKGFYRKAVFRFVVILPVEYPDKAPTLTFVSEVFHPLIHPTDGTLFLGGAFPVWSPSTHYLALLLAFVKRIFYKHDCWTALSPVIMQRLPNQIALQLWSRNRPAFIERCEDSAVKSVARVYAPVPVVASTTSNSHAAATTASSAATLSSECSLVFSRPIPAHEEAFQRIMQQQLQQQQATQEDNEQQQHQQQQQQQQTESEPNITATSTGTANASSVAESSVGNAAATAGVYASWFEDGVKQLPRAQEENFNFNPEIHQHHH